MKPHESDQKIIKENDKNEENALLVNNHQSLDETRDSKKTDFSFRRLGELGISEKIKLTAFMMIAMAILRIFSFDLFVMIGELLTAIIVYLYSIWNNKCMAVLVAINGISGFVYSFVQIFKNILTAKSEKFGYIATINLIVSIFATLVYGIVVYLAYYGFKHFDLLRFGKHEDRHLDKEKDANETSEYGALDRDNVKKDLNQSFNKADKHSNEEHKNKEGEKKGKEDLFDNLGTIGEKAKAAGENLNKLKEGMEQVGDVLNKLGKK